MKPWKLFDVEFNGERWIASAPSRAKARYRQFQGYHEAYGGSFRDFLRYVRVTRRREPLTDDGYSETRTDWGVCFEVGQEVTIDGRRGVIVYAGKHRGRMVSVAFEGTGHSNPVHAMDLKAALQARAA